MRVVLIVNKFPEISQTFIVMKAVGLLKRGWDVHIVCQKTADPDNWQHFPELTSIPHIRQRVHDNLNSIAEMNDCLYKLDPDLVHFEFGSYAIGRIYFKEFLNCKVSVQFRGYDINYYQLDQPHAYDEVWERADALLFVSQDLWRRAQRRGCPSDKRHFCVLHGLDVSTFDPGQRQHTEITGSGARPLRILSTGRLVWKKGYEYALQAVDILQNQGIECEYHIIGGGEYEDALRLMARQCHLEKAVHFLGSVSHERVKSELLWADVLLHAAVSEGFCLAVLEAQAMKVPVVCSDADGLPENIADGVTGFCVPRRNPQALADKMALLTTDPALRQTMGTAGRDRVLQNFHLDDFLTSIEKVYQEILQST